MKLPRFRIGDLMVVSMVVAADIAAWRAIVRRNDDYLERSCLVSLMPMAIVLQCTVLWLRSGHGRRRIFWIAATVSGTLALGSAMWHLADPPSETTTISSSGTSTEIFPGGPAAWVWGPYQSAVWAGLESVGVARPNRWISDLTIAAMFFVPQVLFALGAGLVAEMIAGRIRGSTGISRSEDRIPAWLKQIAPIAAILIIAMIAGGMPVWRNGSSQRAVVDLPAAEPIVDDLKFIELPTGTKPAAP